MFLYCVLALTDETFVWKPIRINSKFTHCFDECFLLKNRNKNNIVVSKLNRVFSHNWYKSFDQFDNISSKTLFHSGWSAFWETTNLSCLKGNLCWTFFSYTSLMFMCLYVGYEIVRWIMELDMLKTETNTDVNPWNAILTPQ